MRSDKLDLNLLVALDALISEQSVTEASRRLYLSQPAVTSALNRLRQYFGDDLLVLEGRQMRLTYKAEELAAPVRQALELIRKRNHTARSIRSKGIVT
jgi:LysR family nod box-dependent transcriptional activator